ncbi:putative glutamine amidotransferase [Desulfosporosinus acidiphilus SJ4]|uniref:Lipid II isoglutaminyl synthase (glutamine-hydrolyzing) subunit GatD n=1 Tax=Desulfosporosinus acidiphilus (strain DSM 22704 / JCM 16185 / SJ4) TaxID=646529 RepID=I4D1Y3_DESAJ|nr:glutamine amidotransferase [Desulfosporosinus acidiphilus]AFM39807.1 putative glutamine amidotransferase [Desulfosporosinus acidiphilus SJ4]
MRLTICHLYPDLLDLYGDRGNILALAARCRWRGIIPEIQKVSLGEDLDISAIDILFLGGGSDREQGLLVQDLMRRENELRAAIENGLVVLAICGGYQMLGNYYQIANGEKIPGLGILDLWTIAGTKRLIGNVVVDLDPSTLRGEIEDSAETYAKRKIKTLVGFENHSGKTYLGEGVTPLGKVLVGHGNNDQDRVEGVRYRNVFGSYLHGPLLPKNPHLTDFLLELALERRGFDTPLQDLDDHLEILAHDAMVNKLLKQA